MSQWLEFCIRGGAAALGFLVLFVVARLIWGRKGKDEGDSGLD